MNNEHGRTQLVELIRQHFDAVEALIDEQPQVEAMADAIIAAGWQTREMWEASQRLDVAEEESS